MKWLLLLVLLPTSLSAQQKWAQDTVHVFPGFEFGLFESFQFTQYSGTYSRRQNNNGNNLSMYLYSPLGKGRHALVFSLGTGLRAAKLDTEALLEATDIVLPNDRTRFRDHAEYRSTSLELQAGYRLHSVGFGKEETLWFFGQVDFVASLLREDEQSFNTHIRFPYVGSRRNVFEYHLQADELPLAATALKLSLGITYQEKHSDSVTLLVSYQHGLSPFITIGGAEAPIHSWGIGFYTPLFTNK